MNLSLVKLKTDNEKLQNFWKLDTLKLMIL